MKYTVTVTQINKFPFPRPKYRVDIAGDEGDQGWSKSEFAFSLRTSDRVVRKIIAEHEKERFQHRVVKEYTIER